VLRQHAAGIAAIAIGTNGNHEFPHTGRRDPAGNFFTAEVNPLPAPSPWEEARQERWEIPGRPPAVGRRWLRNSGRRDWAVILCRLKTLIETGRPLPAFDMSYQREGGERMMRVVRELLAGK
jgi:hypothetical protein